MKHESIYQKKLNRLRQKIDQLDSKILKLLNDRLKIVYQVGLLKKNHRKEICDGKREKEVFQRLIQQNQKIRGKLTPNHLRAIYRSIMSCAKRAQKDFVKKN